VIGWQAVAAQLLLNVSSLGDAPDGLLTADLSRLAPFQLNSGVTMTIDVAIAVRAAWPLVPAAVDAWRTNTRDA
jgi:hypothetical protein